jgi:hypothetical protein
MSLAKFMAAAALIAGPFMQSKAQVSVDEVMELSAINDTAALRVEIQEMGFKLQSITDLGLGSNYYYKKEVHKNDSTFTDKIEVLDNLSGDNRRTILYTTPLTDMVEATESYTSAHDYKKWKSCYGSTSNSCWSNSTKTIALFDLNYPEFNEHVHTLSVETAPSP